MAFPTASSSAAALRRGLYAVCAVTAAGGIVTMALTGPNAPSATAAADPCAASEIARTIGNVAINTGTYLDSHPQTNQALTNVAAQPAGPQSLVSLKAYFDANPQAAKELQVIQQPITALSTRCNLPISLPQVLGLMQAAQQGGLPAGLPAATPPAQSLSGTAASTPAAVPAVPPASAAATGPLPGPTVSTTR